MLSTKKEIMRIASRAMSSHTARASQLIDKVVRVDHAGELGADRIYAGEYLRLKLTLNLF